MAKYTAAPSKLTYTKTSHTTASKQTYQDGTLDYTIFGQNYFSGANVTIYFGNVMIDEIVAMQVALQEQHLPIYGYGSYTYDVMAKGNRIITGSFGIYYKEEGYLFAILDRLNTDGTVLSSSKITSPIFNTSPDELTIEALTSAVDSKGFQKIADAYELALWGQDTGAEAQEIRDRNYDAYFTPRAKETLRRDGFKIVAVFGPEAQKNISDTSILPSKMSDIPTTMRTIHGVHITGSRMVLSSNGDPIYEEYDFMAKDFDNLN